MICNDGKAIAQRPLVPLRQHVRDQLPSVLVVTSARSLGGATASLTLVGMLLAQRLPVQPVPPASLTAFATLAMLADSSNGVEAPGARADELNALSFAIVCQVTIACAKRATKATSPGMVLLEFSMALALWQNVSSSHLVHQTANAGEHALLPKTLDSLFPLANGLANANLHLAPKAALPQVETALAELVTKEPSPGTMTQISLMEFVKLLSAQQTLLARTATVFLGTPQLQCGTELTGSTTASQLDAQKTQWSKFCPPAGTLACASHCSTASLTGPEPSGTWSAKPWTALSSRHARPRTPRSAFATLGTADTQPG